MILAVLFTCFYFSFSFEPISHETATKSSDTIPWQSSRRLTWDDFRGKPDRFSSSVALTSSGIGMTFRSGQDGKPIIEVTCSFFCKNSWVKNEGRNDAVLQHEQLHFDITELYTRRLRQAISKLPVDKRSWQDVSKIYQNVNRECNQRQNEYDNETHHGIKENIQNTWNKQIEAELKLLEEFKSGS